MAGESDHPGGIFLISLPVRPPIVVHHMAAQDAANAPPNSLEAIDACLDSGAACVEVDVTALADSDYLLVHESRLEAETTGHGLVGKCSAADAAGLFIKYNGQDTPFRVPRLSEVVAHFRERPGLTRLQLDFKNVAPFALDEPLRRLVELIRPLGDQVIVSSVADWQLRRLRDLAPWLDLGFDIHFYMKDSTSEATDDPWDGPRQRGAYGYLDEHRLAETRIWSTTEYLADRCAALLGLVPGVSTFYVNHHFLGQSLDDGFSWADALHERGVRLDAWTLDVGDPRVEQSARRLLVAGVDQFTTNTPGALRRLLET